MITAIVMINCEVDSISEAAVAITEIPGVSKVYSVTGDVDLVAVLELADYQDLAQVVTDGIAKVAGVEKIGTHLAFRTYSAGELEQAFQLGLD
ncbi:Lrp/AsnC family transcriptional regulator [Actinomycetaceae bacterium WB03_NA08]|uniref:Lrp/AsnC family transcriptional regulator n=1 Tax=Scrofimicrobium canadense TaxID=2652290 RepID=A0A6N7W9B0_9ACTO|nr:Lrp/AsnC ligand binding domain-containing protein [Scrofimicrobium canadense]MSS84846.1 Lrp/AsnC family transcriptional regulator [Scrofimicrobium canadense]